MCIINKIEDIVFELDKFSNSEKTNFDQKILFDRIKTILYFGIHESTYESIEEFDISKLQTERDKIYTFMIFNVPSTYHTYMPNITLFSPASIQKHFPMCDIRYTKKLELLCHIFRCLNIILSYMLAIYVNEGNVIIL